MQDQPPRRLPRHRRVTEDQRPPMALTARDRAIIQTVNAYRVMTAAHIQALFFNSPSTAQYRLQRLFQHEFLERHFLSVVSGGPASSPALYSLGKRGAQVLVQELGYDVRELRLPKQTFSWQFLEHTLQLAAIRLAVTLAAQQNGWEVAAWQDERPFRAQPEYVILTDKRGKQHQKPVLPDSYFCLSNLPLGQTGRAHFFVEVDRGTEPHSKFRPQILVYEAYVASGQYQARFQAKSLRILIVTTSERRLTNLKAVTQAAGGDRKYWLTTFDKVTPTTILTAPIWQQLESDRRVPLIAAP